MISGAIRRRTGSTATGLQNLAYRCNDGGGGGGGGDDDGDCGDGDGDGGCDDDGGCDAQDRGDYHCNSCPAQTVSSFAKILLLLLLLQLR